MDRRGATLKVSSDPDKWVESGLFDKHVQRHNIEMPHAPIHARSATVYLWIQEQYDKDLADWESRARKHLTHECAEQ